MLITLAVVTGFISLAQERPRPRSQSKLDKKSEKRERLNTLMKQEEEEGEIIFRKHSIFGIKLATDGYGISYESGKYKSNRLTTILQFELNEKKHPKEYKTSLNFDIFGNVNQIIVGKLNNFYQFKAGYGHQYRIGGKANKNGVSVTAIGAGGLSLGLLKPYYVDVENDARQRLRKRYPEILDSGYGRIGAAGLTVGLSEMNLRPGAHAKAALRFDYGRFNEMVSAVEAGLNAEYYASNIPQMARNKEKHFFFNAYITVLFGRRRLNIN